MDNYKRITNYSIGCNDVSDIVLNAILDSIDWYIDTHNVNVDEIVEKYMEQIPQTETEQGTLAREVIRLTYRRGILDALAKLNLL